MTARKGYATFTKAEVRVLVAAMNGLKAARSADHPGAKALNGAAVESLDRKVFTLYAHTHPEEGPFK